ncbi:Pr6Pr family membrane protein [Hyphobacterium sp. HN65]|uniref:Pr6Pr family membrane protein n=1 Tax=Hyphobacterium lacteum TaxID=3116575 RepID=A0ABU7LML5_9PROT|nr:Pr6Pr family membrane protein [Hyphobacterium sp. HN65]MEE2525137.1 Pr6Pr family membrane protein [Hyphobacterium sp. HN65]
MTRLIRGVIALAAGLAVIIQYWAFLGDVDIGAFGATIRFFSYFTILTNSLVAIGWGAMALAPDSRVARVFGRDSIRTAITMYIVLVGIVYHLLLAADHHPTGVSWYANQVLHTLVPAAIFLEWLLLSGQRSTRYGQVLAWQIYPFLYTLYTLAKGAVTGFYPYNFMDVGALGYVGVLVNLAGLIIAFILTGLVFVGVGKLQARLAG